LREKTLSSDGIELEIKVHAVFTARCEVVILVIRYLHECSRLLLNASKMSTLSSNKFDRVLAPMLCNITIDSFTVNESGECDQEK